MRNLYKQKNIFVCKHDTHQHFSSKMSVYHILEERNCYPNGCVYFKWKCKTLSKKKKCHRNFTSVGKHCFSCKHFYEEKIHQFPELKVNKSIFFEQYSEFCDWIGSIKNKRVFCEGIVNSVLPDFVINKNNEKLKLGVKGFLISFKEGFIENQHIEDSFYMHVDSMQQNKVRLRENDEIECKAILKVVDGRLELFYPKNIDFYLRGKSKPLLKSDLLVSLNTATIFYIQYDKCKRCRFSIIPRIQNNQSGNKRILICSKGIKEPELCLENLERLDLDFDDCNNDKSDYKTCYRTL
jgi:hypothetical protein